MGKGVFLVDSGKKLLSMQQIYWRSKGCSPIAAAKVPVHSMSATVQTDLQNLPTSFLQQNVEQTVEFIDIEAFSQSQHVK